MNTHVEVAPLRTEIVEGFFARARMALQNNCWMRV